MVERIKQIMEFYKLSSASFAEQIGINRSNLTHLFSGRNQPSLDLAKKILHTYPEIKTEWLIMGVGEMFRNDKEKEFEIKVQNENTVYNGQRTEPELMFTEVPLTDNTKIEDDFVSVTDVTSVESTVITPSIINEQIIDSREVQKKESISRKKIQEQPQVYSNPTQPAVKKIIFFYTDNSFEIFNSK